MTRPTSVAIGLTAAAAALSLTIGNVPSAAATPRPESLAPSTMAPTVIPPTLIRPAGALPMLLPPTLIPSTLIPPMPAQTTFGLPVLTRLATLRFGAIPLNWAATAAWFGHHARTRRPWAHYTVQRGDTFATIAKRHHVDWFNLAADNKLHMYSVLKAGEVLRLPRAGEKPHAPMPLHAPGSTTASDDRSGAAPTTSASVTPSGSMSSFEQCVITRESGGNPDVMNGSGHWGLFQFSESTWIGYGGSPSAFGNASAAVQEQVFANAMARGGESNWAPYDGC